MHLGYGGSAIPTFSLVFGERRARLRRPMGVVRIAYENGMRCL